ncbi:hypothetical protein LWC08_02205 [Desulfobaculum bizertense]|uniref:hypothetical protein n=1 Tax=Desulfobaculum bizertense TaxID=376490 RepID=UPI001F2F2EC1|nr:hypothetical protein [Desulfobaculum bizertense]UIJ38400.1 hypothetical protein LWC08_02205 [Desulfobaculum bizertense]
MRKDIRPVFLFSEMNKLMSELQFEKLIAGKSKNTTIPYYRRAKELICRGLLSRGADAKKVDGEKEIIGGTYSFSRGGTEGRIFLVERNIQATLLWSGPVALYRQHWMALRDELVGPVPYRLYGVANRIHKG